MNNKRNVFTSNRLVPLEIQEPPIAATSQNVSSFHTRETKSSPKRLTYFQRKITNVFANYFVLICIILAIIFYGLKNLFQSTGALDLSRTSEFLFYEFFLLIISTFIFKRIVSISLENYNDDFWRKIIRKCLYVFALTWISLAHVAYFFFYIPLPDDFFLPVICFVALGAYVHCLVFLLVFYLIESLSRILCFIISRWIPPLHFIISFIKHPIFSSKTFHTLFAIGLALVFTSQGFYSTSQTPTIRNLNILIKDLPKEFNGFSIALITDVHTGPSVGRRRVEEIVKVTNELNADVIAIAGDLVDGYVEYIGNRSKPIKNLHAKFGVYGTLGNHEYFYENVDNWLKFFKNELNITNLINDGVVIKKNGKELCFAGLDDYFAEMAHVEGHKMDLEKALSKCPINISTIVMAHQPKGAAYVLTEMPKIGRKVDLILSGHTHRGQMFVVWPLGFAMNPYFYGLYSHVESGTQIYVSSGVNYWGPPIKMLPSMCEIVNIRLHSSDVRHFT